MKPAVADYQTRVMCLRIVPKTGATIRLTQHPRDLTMSNGTVYLSASGYEFTGYSAASNLAPAMIDLEGIGGLAGIGRDQIASGLFDNARCYLFATNWNAPVEDYEPIVASILGKTTMMDDRYRIEEMALIDALNQSTGKTYTASCPKTFGGQGFAECKKALGPLTVTGTLTSVTSASLFRDSARTELIDYFGVGTIQFTSGANAGLKPLEIKTYIGVKSFAITAITQAASAVVTVGTHTLLVGETVAFSGVVGMTEINGLTGLITAIAATTITVAINSTAFTAYASGGTAATLNGTIETYEPFYYALAVGDAYTLIPGCRKRLSDCRDKWNNVVNFGGFSNVPTSSSYAQVGLK